MEKFKKALPYIGAATAGVAVGFAFACTSAGMGLVAKVRGAISGGAK